jgi:membrane-bound serine protease (ClpP class)
MDSINGKVILLPEGSIALQTAGAETETLEMSWGDKLLHLISDPNIAYILFLMGLYGLMFELYSPGAIFPGIIGVISLILAFYAMHTLPINYAGLGLILFAIILFLLEIKITSYGMLTIGGVVSLLFGSLMLFRGGSPWNLMAISKPLVIAATAVTAAFFLFVIGYGVKAQRNRTVTGTEGMVGDVGEVIESLDPSGLVRVHGEIWQAVTEGEPVQKGEKVSVVAVEGLKLLVKKHSES